MAANGMKGFSSIEPQPRNFRLKTKISMSFQTFCKREARDLYENKHWPAGKTMPLAFVAFNTE